MRYIWICFTLIAVLGASPLYANTSPSDLLAQGMPDKAIASAQKALSSPNLGNAERKSLLELIAKAELTIAEARHYEDVSQAVAAINTLIQEFPDQVDEPALLATIIDLYWKQNALEEAQASILDLQRRFPDTEEAQDSLLTLGKIHFIHHRLADARSAFLRYALHVPLHSAKGREVRLWTAMIDYEEGRYDQALPVFEYVYQAQPDLITRHDNIYARFIQLLRMQGENRKALYHSREFLNAYKTSFHSPEIRLLQADLLLALPNPPVQDIIRLYDMLASKEAGTMVGRQAFMRKLMLQMRDKTTYRDIKPAIIALKRMANQNQLSIIEDEALLHEGKLWEKVATLDAEHSPKSAGEAALQQFSLAAKSHDKHIAQQAHALGSRSFERQIKNHIDKQQWLAAVALWQRFPHFRPPEPQSAPLRFDIARGLRLLMAYEQAEAMLAALHQQAKGSVWGEKIMLERAKLWRDRQDPKGVDKILSWLDKHQYTLYRPEMLVIVAHMQINQQDATAAAHTLERISPQDLAQETRAEYWKVQALTTEKLKRWHMAAKAWRQYAKYKPEEADEARLRQADALFHGKDYARAEAIYAQTPQALQTPVWQYRYGVCQLKTGKWKQATERLQTLKANADAGIYASMAALTLAEQEANRLLKENP